MKRDARAVAARIVGAVREGQSLKQALPAHLATAGSRDRAFVQQLCYGTLRDSPRLLAVLEQLLDKPLRDPQLEALLLLGLYQLDGTRVPDHAAVAATVSATRALGKQWARGLTNAVLRRYLRERESLATTLSPAATRAHPEWLYRRILQQWPAQAGQILQAGNEAPPMTLRVNSQRLSREDYRQRLAAQGLDARAGELSPQALYLAQAVDVQALPGFSEGDVSVQDEAAQMAAPLLQARAGEHVLDACAAPGGKACHILELQPALAGLMAVDVDASRLSRVEENLTRLELQASLLVADASAPPEELRGRRFDRILVDAPCSGSGVLRRHPDIKLLRREADIAALARRQVELLQGLWPLLRPGGTLLYVTCSLLREENSAVVEQLLQLQTDARLATPAVSWGEAAGTGRQLLPSAGQTDGLFFARVDKAGG